MKIEEGNYCVSRMLDVLYVKEETIDLLTISSLSYKEKHKEYLVTKEGRYSIWSKGQHEKDIIKIIEKRLMKSDLFIFDLFQIGNYYNDNLYSTCNEKETKITISNATGEEIKIFNSIKNKEYVYPVISDNNVIIILNKMSRLHEAIKE